MTTRERLACLPKAELHCHLEGTATPALVRAQAAIHGVDISRLVAGDRFAWSGFDGFLRAYDAVSALFRTEEDYARLTSAYLGSIAERGALYAELFVSPDHAERSGLSAKTYLRAVAEGARRAGERTDIICRLIVVGVRHFGREAVEKAARFAVRPDLPLVTGFGLAGDEGAGDPPDFAGAFDIAREAGLGLTAHAGEFAGPAAIIRTLDALKVARLGHGVRAIEDPDLVRRIAAERVVLEVCPGSNIALGLYPDIASHPLRRLKDAGCRVTLNADDPPFFDTDLAREYALAAASGWSEGELAATTRTAIAAAFVDEATRADLEKRMLNRLLALGAAGAAH